MMESCWSFMPIELLDRQKWKVRVELANAIFYCTNYPSPTAPAAVS